MRILNPSGCLHALAAPEVATQLDAFVTKTVTPLPREGSAPPRIAETAHGMLTAIGLANPGRARLLTDHPARPRALAVPPSARRGLSVCDEATGLPIVGMGGIESGGDALEFVACGARDVALGTVLFADRGAPARVRAELAAACAEAGVASPDDARGLAKSPET